ncbi:Acyl-coenzyme A thioesterase 8 [Termitomyces sp. J132]|nr:Acyl-coenzyme A thioesterase 8 [Termitomyces sp. J132]
MSDSNQAEHEQISTSLEVEQLDSNLFRSKSLWVPANARGVFGGQVISQALVSATNCVNPNFGLHSLHCYFLLSASPATAIIYHVDRVRQGRTYATISVRANQNGRTVFVLMCSFQKPEPWQPSHQWPMPHVPGPGDCEDEEVRLLIMAESTTTSREKKLYQDALKVGHSLPSSVSLAHGGCKERAKSPVAIKRAKEHHVAADGTVVYMHWIQARNIPKYEAPFQKVMHTQLHFRLEFVHFTTSLDISISTVPKILGLKRFGKGPNGISMTSSIDHSIYFYNDDFDCGDWLLYVVSSPRSGSGRGVVHGRMYSQNGSLVAVTSQEGVVRANIQGPKDSNVNAKL